MKLLTFLFLFPILLLAQEEKDSVIVDGVPTELDPNRFRLVFYNVENLFDWEDDSLTRDESFTPEGDNHWTPYRFYEKIRKTAQTLASIGGWDPVPVIGLCEVENRGVLEKLTEQTILKSANYKIVHEESADSRGIDVALLYRPERFQVIYYKYIRINFDEVDSRPTRDILHVKGIADGKDTLHVFVNHWPSRYGGHLATDPKRMRAAETLRGVVDSIYSVVPDANLIITGDFNDHPEDASIVKGLQAHHGEYDKLPEKSLYNLMHAKLHKEGTHKFQGEWGILDMWIVSNGLVQGKGQFQTSNELANIYKAPWLIEKESVNLGTRPYRTFQGPTYVGGYSDHLPIVLDLKAKE